MRADEFSTALVERLRSADKVAVLTGAGISAESGVPTFRGEDGLWKKFRPEELANFDAFLGNPALVWEWYQYRRRLICEIEPNAGHYALVKLEEMFSSFTLITQNIDGLHHRAGSRNIIELHGNIMRNKCISCGRASRDLHFDHAEFLHCSCGGLLRPDVVWFGEALPEPQLHLAFQAAGQSDVFLSIGTSGLVQPAALLPLAARQAGAYVVEVNVEETALSPEMDETILGPSGELLPQLVRRLNETPGAPAP